MAKAKQRTEQHLIDGDGEKLLRSQLPRNWLLRSYRPDYGLDFSLEIFQGGDGTETLGEHVFIQLKSQASTKPKPLELFGRGNVEKQREFLDKSDLIGTMDTIRFQLETSELLTVERMGAGVPVLLVIADIEHSRCQFVCLNDYIDKILIPRFGDYRSKQSRTIHVPVLNNVADEAFGKNALRWYGKRAKLLAAFQRITFQYTELQRAWGEDEALEMARYFASRLAEYDFWNDTEIWGPIKPYGDAIKQFLSRGRPGSMNNDATKPFASAAGDREVAPRVHEQSIRDEVLQLWRLLAELPGNHEDTNREWFLPTPLSLLSSYAKF